MGRLGRHGGEGRMVGRHGGGMPGRGRGSRIQAPPNDRPPTIRKLWPGLMTLPTKTMVTNKTLKVSNHPPTHPPNKPTHLLDQHFIISRFQSDQGDQVDKEMKLLLPSILLLLGAIGALAAPPLSEGKGQQRRQR